MLTHPRPSQFGMQLLPMMETGRKALLAAASLQAHAFKAMMRYHFEALGFLKHRYEQDAKLPVILSPAPSLTTPSTSSPLSCRMP
ncbi:MULTISPECIES: hypothetical protein [unclassified Mesorhizobium]|uniref:hypothetical protein n=1 Tax=unclassified Mesorhizobium TaxID=325217 RepID=UPI00333CEC51